MSASPSLPFGFSMNSDFLWLQEICGYFFLKKKKIRAPNIASYKTINNNIRSNSLVVTTTLVYMKDMDYVYTNFSSYVL